MRSLDRGDFGGDRSLGALLAEIRSCTVCANTLQYGPRPVLHVSPEAKLLIVSQAPGSRVHESGVSFDDRSGDRLREWLGIDRSIFYDGKRVALMASAFCYPGIDRQGGDLPPSPACAPLWHPKLLRHLPSVRLTLLVGGYAQRRYLDVAKSESISAIASRWREFLPRYFVLPHPSWRNTGWLKRNSWFETEALPELRKRVASALAIS